MTSSSGGSGPGAPHPGPGAPSPRRRWASHAWLWAPPFIALLGVAATVKAPRVKPGKPPPRPPQHRLERLWSKPTPNLAAFDLDPSGGAVLLRLKGNVFHCLNPEGGLRWGATLSRPSRLLLSRDGAVGLAYTPGNPYAKTLTLLREGRFTLLHTLDGPIQAAGLSPDGTLAAAATPRSIHLFTASGANPVQSRVLPVSGVPRAILAPRSGLVLVSYRGAGGVVAMNAAGRRLWSLAGQPGFIYDLAACPEGRAVGALAYRAGTGDQARAYVLTAAGAVLWQAPVPGIYPRLRLEADGAHAALGWTEVMRAGDNVSYARHIAYYNARGNKLWEKGGLFFSLQLLGVMTPGPGVLAQGASGGLFVFGENGRILSLQRLSANAPIQRATATRDGAALVALRQDQSLEYWRWRSR